MVPAHSHKVSRVSWYSGSCHAPSVFAYWAFTISGRSFQDRSANSWRSYIEQSSICSPNPNVHAHWFGLCPFRSPLLRTSNSFFLFLRLLRCFSSPGSLRIPIQSFNSLFSIRYMRIAHVGFPIQKSAGHGIFAPCRSLSQLITSFIGSQCQGIHPALLFA